MGTGVGKWSCGVTLELKGVFNRTGLLNSPGILSSWSEKKSTVGSYYFSQDLALTNTLHYPIERVGGGKKERDRKEERKKGGKNEGKRERGK